MTTITVELRELLERISAAGGFASLDDFDELHRLLSEQPQAGAGQADASLDDRMRAAGMLSVADLLAGAPLDSFIKHAGVHDLPSLLQWAEMRRAECLKAQARYDLGERDKGDDLYEWTIAHCAVFTELHVNIRAALAAPAARHDQGDEVRRLREALEPFARFRELRGSGPYMSIGGGGGHAEIKPEDWDAALIQSQQGEEE